MAADDFIHFRCPSDLKQEILDRVSAGEYANMTDFMIDAVREKLHPDQERQKMKDALISLITNDAELSLLLQKRAALL